MFMRWGVLTEPHFNHTTSGERIMAAKKATKKVTDSGIDITFESGDALTVNLDQLDQSIVTKLALHGLSQKLGDSYAGAEMAEAFELASSVATRLIEGEWTQAREGGGGGARMSMLVEALAAATGQTAEASLDVVKGMSDEQKKELKKHPAIASKLATIAAERAVEKAAKAEQAAAEAGDLPALPL